MNVVIFSPDLLVDSSAAFLDALRSGVRPTVPESCPAEVSAEVMAPCWSVDPADRPDFRELAARLAAFLDPGYTHRYQVPCLFFFIITVA